MRFGPFNSEWSGNEQFYYELSYDPFMIEQKDANGYVSMVINPENTLTVEDGQTVEQDNVVQFQDIQKAIGLGFFMPSDKLFGLGEREDTLVLKRTNQKDPYELFARDLPHYPDNPISLYGSTPYIQGVSPNSTEAMAWINAAQTWIYIDDMERNGVKGSHVNFVSETGALELFAFASTSQTSDRARRINYDVSVISGFAPLPPIHTLGFHFSKWDAASSDIIRQRNSDFTYYKFPVDVLWMDINWAQNNNDRFGEEYFVFNPLNFTTEGIKSMNQEVEDANRRLTVILDPHIKVSEDYFVYKDGIKLESKR
jgi:alpha 1,3-glucosidase